MSSLSDISEASRDPDLRDRLYSAAAEYGIVNAEQWVLENIRRLVSMPIAEGNTIDTVTSVYAYARDTRPPAPGLNPGAVTDGFLRYAVQTLRDSQIQ